MCCILGMGWQKGHRIKNSEAMRQVASNLLANGQARGRDAAGLAFVDAKDITVLKHNMMAKSLVNEKEFQKMCEKRIAFSEKDRKKDDYNPLISVIGHCRQKTQGTPQDYNNNHPIVANKVVGVHNGMISNDGELFRQFKDLGMDRRAEVDSEIIFRLIDHYVEGGYSIEDAIIASSKLLIGSFACAVVHAKNPYTLWLFRGNGPIDIYHYKDIGLIMFSSSKSFIEDAVKGIDIGQPTVIPLLSFQGIGIDLHQNMSMKFELQSGAVKGMNNFYA